MSIFSKKKDTWCAFTQNALQAKREMRKLYVVEGDPYSFSGGYSPFLETTRHVRKTLTGLIRQVVRDGCMNERNIRIYEFDLAKMKPIFEGKIK